jgi:anionic cell wall polymer biosynthesis LytR-Cps2A-Psr (LCP) family protein
LQYASSALLDQARDDGSRRGRRSGPPRQGRNRKSGRGPKDPLWAKLLVIFGALIMLSSGTFIVGQRLIFTAATSGFNQTPLLDPDAPKQHVTINGPKNILLVGIDSRPGQNPTDLVRADSVMILHIAATHDRAYLVSIPRDTYVEVPPFNNGKVPYRGGHDKINASFAWGGQGLTGTPAKVQAFRLLQQTIAKNWDIRFQAGAIVDFAGFQQVVSVLGGVWMNVDEETKSIHVGHTRDGKFAVPYRIDSNTVAHPIPGVIPQTYHPGYQHLAPWEALDYVRQRDTIPDGDYGRVRHQQQFIKAVFKGILNANVLTDPGKLNSLIKAVSGAMTIDNGGIDLEDWIVAMRTISASNVMTIKTNGGQFNSKPMGELGDVEVLNDTSIQLLDAVRGDNVDGFVQAHTDWVSVS